MNTTTMNTWEAGSSHTTRIPCTARGRALYTVSWFLHGKRPQTGYDHAGIPVTEIRHVYA